MNAILFPMTPASQALFLKAIKNKAGYALYGNPPRWHKVGQDKPAPADAHHVAISHYHVAAVKKLKQDAGFHALSHDEQVAKVKQLATDMQAAASASAAVSGWKKAALAGKNPTPAQWKAYHDLPADKKNAILDQVTAAVGSLSHLVPPHMKQIQAEAKQANNAEAAPPKPAAATPEVEPDPNHSSVQDPDGKPLTAKQKIVVGGIEKYLGIDLSGTASYIKPSVVTLDISALNQQQIHAIENYGNQFGHFKVTPGGYKKLSLVMPKKPTGNGGAKPAAEPVKPAPTPAPPPADNPANKAVTGAELSKLPDGSVIQITVDGKPWRRAKKISGSWHLEKVKGSGWMANPLTPQQSGWLHAGEYGEYSLVSEGKVEAVVPEPVPAPDPEPAKPPSSNPWTDEQWSQLYLPMSNTNASSHNKKVDALKNAADAGDVAAIQAMKFGSNTYGKKQAKIAEHLLAEMAKVGQPAQSAPEPEPAASPAPEPAKIATGSTFTFSSQYEKMNKGDWVIYNQDADFYYMHKVGAKVPNKSNTVTIPKASLHEAIAKGTAKPAKVPAAVIAEKTSDKPTPAAAPASSPPRVTSIADLGKQKAEKKQAIIDAVHAAGFGVQESKTKGLLFSKWKGGMPYEFLSDESATKTALDLHKKGFDVQVLGGEDPPFYVKILGLKDGVQPVAAKPAQSEPSPAPQAAPAQPVTVGTIEYHNTQGKSSKFWAGSTHGNVMKTSWGKIGTKGQSTEKVFGSEAEAKAALKKLVAEKTKKGYQEAGLHKHEYSSAAVDTGPKEGDIKQGADGLLVLKDGHWRKMNADEKSGSSWSFSVSDEGFDGASTLASDTGVIAAHPELGFEYHDTASFDDDGVPIMALTAAELLSEMHANGHDLPPLADMKKLDPSVTQKDYPAAATPAPDPAPSDGVPEKIDGWTMVGGQEGYNDGAYYTDPSGQKWYCKFSSGGEDVARSEMLALKLYEAAGQPVPEMKLISKGGKVGTASRVIEGLEKNKNLLRSGEAKQIFDGFAADAWLANWDVVGNNPAAGKGWDNIQFGPDGKAYRIDAGGALAHKGTGAKKGAHEWTDHVVELKTLRDPSVNANTAKAFAKMSDADIAASVAKVVSVTDAQIRALVSTLGPGSAAEKKALADRLIARRNSIAGQVPTAKPGAKAKKPKKAPVFDPSKLGTPPDFMNWSGPGKHGPATSEFRNKANQEGVNRLLKIAQAGDIEAIKKTKLPLIDANTGAVTGEAFVLDHPSQYVRSYAQQLINEIDMQLNPPKAFRFRGDSGIKAIHDRFPVNPNVATAAEKLGKYVVLGHSEVFPTSELAALEKHTYKNGKLTMGTYVAKANAAIKQMPKLQKDALKSYTGGGYSSQNKSLWSGNPTGAAKSASEALNTYSHEIIPGTILSRKIDLSGQDLEAMVGKDLVATTTKPGQVGLSGATGKVLQEPAIMSTSISPDVWSGNVHLKLTVGPGVKGMYVGKGTNNADGVGSSGFSNHPGEKEVILPPNCRMLVQKVVKSNYGDEDGFGVGSSYVVEALILPNNL